MTFELRPRQRFPGFWGRFLDIDLATSRVVTIEPDLDWWRARPGGVLMATEIIRAAEAGGASGLDSPLVFAGGAVSGHPLPGLALFGLVGRSPASGAVVDARVEGPFAQALKRTGTDAVAFRGRAEAPVYLLLNDGVPEICDASDIVGLATNTVVEWARANFGRDAHVAAIGPAGENGVSYASIVCDGSFAAARGGLGALMGAKNLKAVVVVGGELPHLADPEAARSLGRQYEDALPAVHLADWQQRLPGFGAWAAADGVEGYVAVENFRTSRMPLMDGHQDRDFRVRASWNTGGCPGCPGDCIKGFASRSDPRGLSGGLHQEAIPALSVNLGHGQLDAALDANALTHQLGLDPASLGMTLSWACEAREAGSLSRPEQGPDLRFGTEELAAQWASTIAMRQGLGEVLADGVQSAAQQVGAAGELAMHCGGLELPPFDPRRLPGLSLAWVVSPTGPRYDACEHDADFDPQSGLHDAEARLRELGLEPLPALELSPGKAVMVAQLLRLWSGLDALLICPFAGPPTRVFTMAQTSDLVAAVTGWQVVPETLLGWGQQRLDALRDLHPEPDSGQLPDRFFLEPIDHGPHAGAVLDRAEFEAASHVLRGELGWGDA